MGLKNNSKLLTCLVSASFLFPSLALADSYVSFEGSSYKVIEIKPESSSGLNNLFVVRDIAGTSIVYRSKTNTSNIAVFKFGMSGASGAEEVRDAEINGTSVTINNPSGDCGYYIEENGIQTYYFWVVNYAPHQFSITSISASPDQQCESTVLDIAGNAGPIYYYGLTGQRVELSREIEVYYTTQEYSEETGQFLNVDKKLIEKSLSSLLYVTPPAFCSTYFTISGDRFLQAWGEKIERESSVIQPVAVACKTWYVNENDPVDSDTTDDEDADNSQNSGNEGSNIIKGDDSLSAPTTISFYAATTDAAIFYEWQVARDENFENLVTSSSAKDFDYTFNEDGTYFVQFVAASENDYCMASEQYSFKVGASDLICPNAFSPNGDGVNDIWKVSYRSLIDFHCEIFNRNGQHIYSFSDPSGGWDGTYHGKRVKSGVYYYVIVATGADGKKYKKSGDINIINSKYFGNSSSSTESVE